MIDWRTDYIESGPRTGVDVYVADEWNGSAWERHIYYPHTERCSCGGHHDDLPPLPMPRANALWVTPLEQLALTRAKAQARGTVATRPISAHTPAAPVPLDDGPLAAFGLWEVPSRDVDPDVAYMAACACSVS